MSVMEELCTGAIKRRFHCLQTVVYKLQYYPTPAWTIIVASFVLHNMAIKSETHEAEEEEEDENNDNESCTYGTYIVKRLCGHPVYLYI